jgi:hypothetical protein
VQYWAEDDEVEYHPWNQPYRWQEGTYVSTPLAEPPTLIELQNWLNTLTQR